MIVSLSQGGCESTTDSKNAAPTRAASRANSPSSKQPPTIVIPAAMNRLSRVKVELGLTARPVARCSSDNSAVELVEHADFDRPDLPGPGAGLGLQLGLGVGDPFPLEGDVLGRGRFASPCQPLPIVNVVGQVVAGRSMIVALVVEPAQELALAAFEDFFHLDLLLGRRLEELDELLLGGLQPVNDPVAPGIDQLAGVVLARISDVNRVVEAEAGRHQHRLILRSQRALRGARNLRPSSEDRPDGRFPR